MANLFFTLPGNLTLKIESDTLEALHPNDLVLAQGYLPGLEFASLPDDSVTDITCTHHQTTDKPSFEETGRHSVVLHDAWTDRVSMDTFFLLYGLVRRALLDHHLFSVHAACVEDDAGTILLVGHSGAGKTQLALELIDQGKRLISGNKTVINWSSSNAMETIAGTQTVTLHESSGSDRTDGISYDQRNAFTLTESSRTAHGHIPIRAIALVRLNDGVESVERFSQTSALHRLFPFFLDLVNADVLIGTSVLTDKRPEGIESVLATHLSTSLETLPVFRVEGSLSFLSKTISSL